MIGAKTPDSAEQIWRYLGETAAKLSSQVISGEGITPFHGAAFLGAVVRGLSKAVPSFEDRFSSILEDIKGQVVDIYRERKAAEIAAEPSVAPEASKPVEPPPVSSAPPFPAPKTSVENKTVFGHQIDEKELSAIPKTLQRIEITISGEKRVLHAFGGCKARDLTSFKRGSEGGIIFYTDEDGTAYALKFWRAGHDEKCRDILLKLNTMIIIGMIRSGT